ncbi:ATP synthase subunit s, mitochondrial [Ceratitis capitata]|uniref:(Mediterranean fruit fly) hypothetical protein n=1 Tax=Ceratitis capitata TaxID=7213 RepID=A0A811V7S0_CERCA|nr:ATP synthase subunit s, mitochondrial [Ceratitis capitata]CAD7011327.1 unnamed protein product [Ceratitis capitata]
MVILQRIYRTNLMYHFQRATIAAISGRASYELKKTSTINLQNRSIWGYVAIAFNRVDKDRLSKVGPDRLCSEWILKNGGGVGLVGMQGRIVKNYNSLPPESVKFNVKVVDASDSSIMKIGLEHFAGCHHIDTVVFHNCKHLEDGGLEGLTHLKSTLKRLQVSGCYNLRDACLDVISQLTALEHLRLFDLIYVKDIQGVAKKLQKELPNCKIEAITSK